MAKLPEIQYRRGAPDLKSPRMAKLPNQIRNISAAVGAGTKVAAVVGKELDNLAEDEARLDAGRRFNEYQREYAEGYGQLLEDLHDPDKNIDDLPTAEAKMRGDLEKAYRKGASPRSMRYLGPTMDDFHTRARGQLLSDARGLAESRTIMQLEMGGREAAAQLGENPNQFFEIYETQGDLINGTSLSPEQKLKQGDKWFAENAPVAINAWLADENVEALDLFMNSSAFSRLTAAGQANMRTKTDAVRVSRIASDQQALTNGVRNGSLGVSQAFTLMEDSLRSVVRDDISNREFDKLFDDAAHSLYVSEAQRLVDDEEFGELEKFLRQEPVERLLTSNEMNTFSNAEATRSNDGLKRAAGVFSNEAASIAANVRKSGEANPAAIQMSEQLIASYLDAGLDVKTMEANHRELLANDAAAVYYKALKDPTTKVSDVTALLVSATQWANEPGPLSAERTAELTQINKAAVAFQKQMENNPAGGIVLTDPSMADLYAGVQRTQNQVLASMELPPDDPARQQAEHEHRLATQFYEQEMALAQEQRGVPIMDRDLLPDSDEFTAAVVAKLDSSSRQDQLAGLQALARSGGSSEYQRAQAQQIANGDAGFAAALDALSKGDDILADTYLKGRERHQAITTQGGRGGDTDISDGELDNAAAAYLGGTLIPENYGVTEGLKLRSAMRYLILGYMTDQELAGGDQRNVNTAAERAFADVFGEPVAAGTHPAVKSRVLPYTRQDTGSRVEGTELRLQMDSLRDPEVFAQATGVTDIRDASGAPLDLKTALDNGILTAVGNGQYTLELQSSFVDVSLGGVSVAAPGMVRDPQTQQPLVINLNNAPVPTAKQMSEYGRFKLWVPGKDDA